LWTDGRTDRQSDIAWRSARVRALLKKVESVRVKKGGGRRKTEGRNEYRELGK
jgi:hypothetical protein